ncbi:phage holin [uncultured Rummeliibacillus sp.]|uniref:phage holin n=1 Tax=uncultured Rummeliibacillus sp. TaxID=762292 RepID=UPI002611F7A9|nr:phage holin [uncultured Rummeliibacillus sp.]
MTTEKLKQYIGLFGGWLGAVLLFLQSIGVTLAHFNNETIDAFVGVLEASVPFVLVAYGVYKNSYLLSKKAKIQEELLKKKGLK